MKFRVTSILLLLLVVASPVFAINPALPSQGLEQRVNFWKKVYVQYGADDVIIHDRIYVNLIYDVATKASQNAKIAEIQNALREIQSNLETPNNLSPIAAQIFAAIVTQSLPLSSSLIDDLIANIHIQIGIKERFRDGIIRSGRYVDKFREIMKDHDLPTELALLPLVESSFQNVKSKAGAVGVWQFTTGTGKLYMKITTKVDERLDPIRSSETAAHFLRDNYKVLGAWPLAITAYNHGRGGMLQAQKLYGSDLPAIIGGYRGSVFGYASMNFYSEFLAAVEVYKNYQQYFGELTLDRPDSPPYEGPTMRALNLSAKIASTPAKSAAAVVAAKYKVRNGDTLWDIAQRFGTPIRNLMDKNKLNNPVIYAGQVLLVKQVVHHHHLGSGRNAISTSRFNKL
jgi:membrane-bound lytic murein transglycosylase D